MEKMKILLVEDEKEIADLVEIYLKNEGYAVFKACDACEGLQALEQENFQLVLLDIMMPGMNGLEALREIRKTRTIPVIMLTAKAEDMDKIMGLTTGADDYVTKPFHPLELVARVKSQIRRYVYFNTQRSEEPPEDIIRMDGLNIYRQQHRVTLYDRPVNLTPIEFDILLLLASNPGRVFSAEEIFERVWKEKFYASNNTVMVHIRKIREKIEDEPGKNRYIKTVWGVGYKIEKQIS